MKVFFERETKEGMVLLRWRAETADGQELTKEISAVGRKVFHDPEGPGYIAQDLIAVTDAQFEAIKAGVCKDGERSVSFTEMLPGRKEGQRFEASLEGLLRIVAPDPDRSRRSAGDELDGLAKQLAAADGIPYTQAFRRITVLHPDLYARYRQGAD